MDRSSAQAVSPDELTFRDGLGDRFLIRDTSGRPLHESLLLRAPLSGVPSFEFALNERVWLLETFDHHSFLLIRNMVRFPGRLPRLSIVSDYGGGTRLSEFLSALETRGEPLPTSTALFFVKEILEALAALHRQPGDISHGALSPERIVVADGRIRIADYVMGSAIEQLRYSSERYWKELRVAVPASAGGARLDRRVDVAQIGMIAVALLAGRPLRETEHIGGLADVLMGLTQEKDGSRTSLALPIRGWLLKALHMDPRRVFVNALEAQQALEVAMAEADLRPSPGRLDSLAAGPKSVNPTIPFRTVPTRPVVAFAPMSPVKKPMSPRRDSGRTQGVASAASLQPRSGMSESVRRTRVSPGFGTFLWIALVGVLVVGAFTVGQFVPAPDWLLSRHGTLVIESKPQGVPVFVDGKAQGVTPMTLSVESGRHEVELRGAGKPRVFNVLVASRDRVAQYVEFQSSRPSR
jgi:hypothetical protein